MSHSDSGRATARFPTAAEPLAGLRVVVTRPAHQAEGLCAAFAAAGAEVARLPMIAVEPPRDRAPLDAAAARLERYRWVAFTSTNAVRALADAAGGSLPGHLRAAAVGEATARVLRDLGVEPEVVAEDGTGASLAQDLAAADPELAEASQESPLLLPLASDARPDLAEGLRRAGAAVEAVVAYDKRAPEGTADAARALFPPGRPLGWVTFTSPRIARTFARLLDCIADDEDRDGWPSRRTTLRAISIGPTTTATLRRLGVEPAAEAETPGDREMVEAMVRAVRHAPR